MSLSLQPSLTLTPNSQQAQTVQAHVIRLSLTLTWVTCWISLFFFLDFSRFERHIRSVKEWHASPLGWEHILVGQGRSSAHPLVFAVVIMWGEGVSRDCRLTCLKKSDVWSCSNRNSSRGDYFGMNETLKNNPTLWDPLVPFGTQTNTMSSTVSLVITHFCSNVWFLWGQHQKSVQTHKKTTFSNKICISDLEPDLGHLGMLNEPHKNTFIMQICAVGMRKVRGWRSGWCIGV